ncbi:tRNA pseudouridine synthase [Gregarina niphandrodes]|uniref:tRNA pseudouridine synthase n=1 Tax=Gregarina niphandrodes TaxID=110365 RepID=A0A023BDH6_GRENI|nr:tRNA pseudouridine synthase [Gregarina niphandrodes]EZG88192.1 tRNA pseudouridine synthase [Gregarina niphandrodes]|eukprot:XP_011128616.1 tRNA pseudouridine synthase [Gregarina niphandrodes]
MHSKRRRTFDCSLMGSFLIRFTYDGSSFFGLAKQNEESSASYFKNAPPGVERVLSTVEGELENVLRKANMIKSLAESLCSRCGRTDRGVHARANYISIRLRLNPEGEEYNYALIMNGMLPDSIRVVWVRRCPVWFDARFHCLYRMYKYYFADTGLDLVKMDTAAQCFVGDHDFKNFCKQDPDNQKTTRRRIFHCRVKKVNPKVGVVLVTGPAFLWHQVRCIVGCLMDIGNGVHPVSVVNDWLYIKQTKPPYTMAPPDGLVLWDCAFEDINPNISQMPTAQGSATQVPAKAHACDENVSMEPLCGGDPLSGNSNVSTALPQPIPLTPVGSRCPGIPTFEWQLFQLEIRKCVLKSLASADNDSLSFFKEDAPDFF